MKIATFYGGALNDKTSVEYIETVNIGLFLADRNYTIKSGGYKGLMEAVSMGANISVNKVDIIGYTCESFGHWKGNAYLNKTIVCPNIYDRLEKLIKDSQLFVIQKGGIGTIAEIFLTLDIIRKQIENVPNIILIGDFWIDIFNSLKVIISEKELKLITIVKNYDEFSKLDIFK